MVGSLNESTLESAALEWLASLGYAIVHGPDIAPEQDAAERISFAESHIPNRLQAALKRINPHVPPSALEDAFRKLTRLDSPSLVENNRRFHAFVTEGVPVEVQAEGRTVGESVRLFDWEHPDNNDWLAVNQFTVIENHKTRRADVVVFVNGLPLAVLELKNLADENATIQEAFKQLGTYKQDVPGLFAFNEALVISDGIQARIGSLTANREWFMPWRTVEGEALASANRLELETLLKGVFEKRRFLDLIRNFVVFETDGAKVTKKMAGYHQFHAVNKAVEMAVKAASPQGDRRVGVVWHTQGSGKSLSMLFFSGKIIQHPALANPTLVLLTDRNDLDGQLFDSFSAGKDLLRQTPEQAQSRDDLRRLLRRAAGGVVFTTIHKFMVEGGDRAALSDRRNIICIADEAHRSQYDFIDGFARRMREALPNASFIGFTGTPLELTDKNTRAVFGEYIDIYDIQRAVEDGATVRIYYEARLAKLELKSDERPVVDAEFEELTEGEEVESKEKLKSKWARLEAMVGTEKRIDLVARDILQHFEARLEALDGKGMIVCMSRRICVDLYNAIIKLRPPWFHRDDDKGFLKVVMTGSASDGPDWQPHIRDKIRRDRLADNFKDAESAFKLAIVRDMWLTGFDVPPLHTMYIDKPMRGHGLMQAIARVNRVYKDKQGGLIVDYLGIAEELKKALSHYTEQSRDETGVPQEEAVAVMLEKYEVVLSMFHGFDLSKIDKGSSAARSTLVVVAMNHILGLEDGKARYFKAVMELCRTFALSVPNERALAIRDHVAFFQAVRGAMVKYTVTDQRAGEDLDSAIRQIVSKAIASDQIVDIFDAAGLKKPDISILSDEFLEEVRGMEHKNLALELLRKLLNDELKTRSRTQLVQSRRFSEMLESSIRRYQNRILEAAKVIEEMIALAKDIREADRRGVDLGLNEAELAFYEALEVNDSAVKVLGDSILKAIAQELVDSVRKNATIDWTVKENVRAKMRVHIRRILKKHGYPPDMQEKATQTVLEQAELMAEGLAA